MARIDYWDDPAAPTATVIVPAVSMVGIDSDLRHVVAYDDGEVRQAFSIWSVQHGRVAWLSHLGRRQ
ncbi:hypothetical protein [Tenggerimyces flavus]|uniref:Uncharacterized protein n=1 Tax=Tenggerimyces flavus TaxID=1708749 RepID=A0ABV7Y5I0_9ACTN|nr:hypothetical protein [Tenggerimyces flavus]MBM7790994.1 hypothetical protein [Tenggerimyces flavus]